MYTIFFAAFVLMVLTVFSNSESGGPQRADIQSDAATSSLVKPAIPREYASVALALVGAGLAALVGLYLQLG